jgi:molybdopterin-biosynthesis enzyme MoeA-like protein
MCGRNNNFTVNNSRGWHDHKAHFTLGIRANVQPKSSIPIGAKVVINPGGFTPGVKVNIEKKLFNLPQVTNKC